MAVQIPAQRKGRTQPTYVVLVTRSCHREECTYYIGSVSLNCEDNGCGDYRANNGAKGPEQGQAV
jgi:hypothetical protein